MQALTSFRALVAVASVASVLLAAGCSGVESGETVAVQSQAIVGGPALLVVGSATLNAGDAAISSRLQALGMTVTVRTAAAATIADATGKQVVVISSTVTSSVVGTKFRAVAVPMLLWESAILDDMGMTGATSGTDFGTLAGQQRLVMVAGTGDPMAAGLSGTQTVVSAASTFSWGRPAATAVNVAHANGDTSRSVLFRYEKGTQMVGLAAPERRAALFLEDTTASVLTTAGRSLIDAAIRWTAHQAANGVACAQGSDCGSGQCASGVCCNTACTGVCLACNIAGRVGTCSASAAGTTCGAPSCALGVLSRPTCDGTGACATAGVSCAPFLCASAAACGTTCTTDANCAAGAHCTNGLCVANAGLGQPCTRGAECGSGQCAGGVCCNTACTGVCLACNIAGRVGTCSASAAGTTCGAPSCALGVLTRPTCDGNGACATAGVSCAPFLCASAAACGTTCTTDANCAAGAHCTNGVCVANAGLGQPCTRGAECGSGQCASGVCCNTACTGVCQACNIAGRVGTCSASAAGTTCGVPSCALGVLTRPTCDGTGACATAGVSCAPFLCASAAACGTTCTTDANCAAGAHCTNGLCA